MHVEDTFHTMTAEILKKFNDGVYQSTNPDLKATLSVGERVFEKLYAPCFCSQYLF